MDGPEVWRWIWLGVSVAFAVGEMSTAGALFLLPFAVGAALASALAFLDVGLGWEWATFLAVSLAVLAALRPIARRLEAEAPMQGVGASRWVGQVGVVIADIPADPSASGSVRVDREEWRAEAQGGVGIAEGVHVRVVAVAGTRLVVEPVAEEA